ncbi:hypothetical protein [Prescottella agglutinans]|uniref:DUF5666 domain-containing protein n=1 Tax=Prescottella agglutinans TaxID=1644129 RepID=A0ABT6MKU8_9NOCA|nr:hypothetical protein [Prescottella agglutinans]MDH6284951.1 hypothetical protein [Prescottella agglutinans]
MSTADSIVPVVAATLPCGAVPTPGEVADRPRRRFVGTVGREIGNMKVVVRSLRHVESTWGADTKIVLETPDGRRLAWYRKRPTSLRPGDVVTITHAHVKRHRTGGRQAETLITHISLQEKEKLRREQGDCSVIA